MMNKYIVQLLSNDTGKRSQSFVGTLPKIVSVLSDVRDMFAEHDTPPQTSVILIGYTDENGALRIINDHIFRLENFLEHYKGREAHFEQMTVEMENT